MYILLYIITHECVCISSIYECVITGCLKLCFHYFIQNILQKPSVGLTTLLVPEPVCGPRESAMTVRPVGGAEGPSDDSVRPHDALKAAGLFLRETVGCVQGLAPCQGRGAPLDTLPGSRVTVPGQLQVGGRGRDVPFVRGVLARGSV